MITSLFGVPTQALFGQLLLGLINGAFYAMLSLGLAVIYGLLQIANFVHGALYMMGAFVAWLALRYFGIGYWEALVVAPVVVGAFGVCLELVFLRPIYKLPHLYGFLLTYGLTLIIEGLFRNEFGSSGQPYPIPAALRGGYDLGFMFLPTYRAWVVIASLILCISVWFAIERTKLGSYLRAATEKPQLVLAFGIDVPKLITWTYAFGVGLAALAGVLAAPIYQVSPLMGSNLLIVVFAVVVIGGMGSIMGSIVSGFALGIIEGLTKVFYPEASNTAVFVVMAIVLLIKPAGLFGHASDLTSAASALTSGGASVGRRVKNSTFLLCLGGFIAVALVAPHVFYSYFLMKALCFALFACAFNLLIGFVGLLSFGHAAFFGSASYVTAHLVKYGWSGEIGLLAGVASAAFLGLCVGLIAIRRQGIYFAMITLALSQMIYFIALQAPFTGGEDGIQAVPRPVMFGFLDLSRELNMYYFVLAVFLAGFLFLYRTINSPFGQVLKAIRENEPRAVSLGYDVNLYKLVAFVLSAALAGLAGSTKALVFQLASLTDVHWAMSGEVMLMTLIGGIGTLTGPIVGAFVSVAAENYLAEFGAWVLVFQGVIFLLCVMIFRRGIVGELAAIYRSGRVARLWRGRLVAPPVELRPESSSG